MKGATAVSEAIPKLSSEAARLPPRLTASHVGKRFGDLLALDDVSFDLKRGSFHALLGENGAGKSTLVKCIMGFYQADQGELSLDGKRIEVHSPRDAQRHGIGMVYQHFTLVENMTVTENLVLSRADLPVIIDWKKETRAVQAFMNTTPFRVGASRLVRQLAAGEKQKLEILKQLYLGSRIIILDEPTSVLTPEEADEVLGMLRGMAHEGKLSVILITHRFREVMQFADEVTVLRRGRFAGHGKTSALTPETMGEMMVGKEQPNASLERTDASTESDPVLVVDGLVATDEIGLKRLNQVTLSVRPGEILGIAGVSGNGQEELVEVLAGQRDAVSGSIRVRGEEYRATRSQTQRLGVRLLPETPMRNACVGNMSVSENIAFRTFDSPGYTKLRWFVHRPSLTKTARKAISDFRIKTPSPETPISDLSGGNVQRALLARELSGQVNVLVAANPCFGLDFAAVSEIRTRIMEARNSGTAVLLISADLDEIFALSDRIAVMSEGAITYETSAKGANVAEMGRHMAGHHQ